MHQRLLDDRLLQTLCSAWSGRGRTGPRAAGNGDCCPGGGEGEGLSVLRLPCLDGGHGWLRRRHRPVVQVFQRVERHQDVRQLLLRQLGDRIALQSQLPQRDELLQAVQLLRALQLVARQVEDLQRLPTVGHARGHVRYAVPREAQLGQLGQARQAIQRLRRDAVAGDVERRQARQQLRRPGAADEEGQAGQLVPLQAQLVELGQPFDLLRSDLLDLVVAR
mmetsp:Transcript_7055/g.16073  ORF Transcript_7055/g.16073 Transcript_7055/m.16073 type:complete len:221 (-) Transcript_7055:532-1194(-)